MSYEISSTTRPGFEQPLSSTNELLQESKTGNLITELSPYSYGIVETLNKGLEQTPVRLEVTQQPSPNEHNESLTMLKTEANPSIRNRVVSLLEDLARIDTATTFYLLSTRGLETAYRLKASICPNKQLLIIAGLPTLAFWEKLRYIVSFDLIKGIDKLAWQAEHKLGYKPQYSLPLFSLTLPINTNNSNNTYNTYLSNIQNLAQNNTGNSTPKINSFLEQFIHRIRFSITLIAFDPETLQHILHSSYYNSDLLLTHTLARTVSKPSSIIPALLNIALTKNCDKTIKQVTNNIIPTAQLNFD